MLGIVLALASAASWGAGDFWGGLLARRLPSLQVVAWSQFFGGIMITAIALLVHAPVSPAILGWGAVAGVCGLWGVFCLYRGLALGPMAIVSPVSACGAIIPLLVSLLFGHPPTAIALLGAVSAFAGVVLASLSSSAEEMRAQPQARGISLGVVYAILAALGFGFFFLCLARGSASGSLAGLWAVTGARASSLVIVFTILAGRREATLKSMQHVRLLIATGVADTLANTLYAFATTRGNLGIVSVIGNLYPVMTVLLAFVVLSERLTIRQMSGVSLAMLGVALMTVG